MHIAAIAAVSLLLAACSSDEPVVTPTLTAIMNLAAREETIASDPGGTEIETITDARVPFKTPARGLSDAERRFRRDFERNDPFVDIYTADFRVVLDKVTSCVYTRNTGTGLVPLLSRQRGSVGPDCGYG